MIRRAIRQKLVLDTDVTTNLAEYGFGTNTSGPAIFINDDYPDDVEFPAIIISTVDGASSGTRGNLGAMLAADVHITQNKLLNTVALDTIALAVWKSLQHQDLEPYMAGYGCHYLIADPPKQSFFKDGYPGRLVACRADIYVV